MAHPQQLQFLKTVTQVISLPPGVRVIEIGAYDVNGSVRQFFRNSDYVGVDLVDGPGVDLVYPGGVIDHPSGSFDVALSCECFEHNPDWRTSFSELYRLSRIDSLILVTCATTGRAEHGTSRTSPELSPGTRALSWDYYSNLVEEDFHRFFELNSMFSKWFFIENSISNDLYFVGFKGRGPVCGVQHTMIDLDHLKSLCLLDQSDLQELMQNRRKRARLIPKVMRPLFKGFINGVNNIGETNPRLLTDF